MIFCSCFIQNPDQNSFIAQTYVRFTDRLNQNNAMDNSLIKIVGYTGGGQAEVE